jgi:hypothetical protein
VALRPGNGRVELRPLVEDVLAIGGEGARRRELRHDVGGAAVGAERLSRALQRVYQRRVAILARLQRRCHRGALPS